MVQCPDCGKVIVDKSTDGGVRVRSRMVHIKDGQAVALCPQCKANVPVPLAFTDTEQKPSQQPKPKLVVRR